MPILVNRSTSISILAKNQQVLSESLHHCVKNPLEWCLTDRLEPIAEFPQAADNLAAAVLALPIALRCRLLPERLILCSRFETTPWKVHLNLLCQTQGFYGLN